MLVFGKKSDATELLIMDPGYCSDCVKVSKNRRILLRFPSRARNFPFLQRILAGSGTHKASCPVGSGVHFRMLQ